MPFTFTKKITGDVKPIIDTAKKIAKVTGAYMDGDEESGTFSINTAIGLIAGSYVVKDGVITITVHKKPFLIHEVKIKAALDKFFS